MSSFPHPCLVNKFFNYCFGYNNKCVIPTITPELVETIGRELESYFNRTIKTSEDHHKPFIRLENKVHMSASSGCLKRLISTGIEGSINDEVISIFIDALNYYLGHHKSILMQATHYILDSISSNNLVLINEEGAENSEYEFPNINENFASLLHQQVKKRISQQACPRHLYAAR